MHEEIQNVKNQGVADIMEASDSNSLEEVKITYLGRNGKINKLLQGLKEIIKPEEKKEVGRLINEVKQIIENQISEKDIDIKKTKVKVFDQTIPGDKPKIGHLHLVTHAIREIENVFSGIGFTRVRYPEVEWDWFAFGALNFPENHPARDDWETFFVNTKPNSKYGPMLLTPHTSSGQIREMERLKQPPIRMINIAKCYRRQIDAKHYPMFHQFEGLVVDNNISIVNLKGTLDYFARNFFGPSRKIRLRPYHFQFTEPSFEVDINCSICFGKGCKVCKEGWLELGGAGMVHPQVLKNGGIDPNTYSGFAFGWGVERTFMMKANLSIPDIRLLYSYDLNVLKQF